MRIAAAVVGGIGALVGAAKGGLGAGIWLSVAVAMGNITNPVSLLLVGSEGATAIFGILGIVGTGFVLAGRRFGDWFMLAGGPDWSPWRRPILCCCRS